MSLFLRRLLVGVMAASPVCGVAQARSNLKYPLEPVYVAEVGPQAEVADELHTMAAQAGVIFAGEVLAVRPQGDAGTGWVEVEFRVEEAIRGCAGQGTYRLREWAGLWTGGVQRYRVGEQLLMLLHAPSAMGLSSPVGGQDGAIPIMGGSIAFGPKNDFAGVGEQAVDLRWIEARLLRTTGRSHGSGLHGRPARPIEPVHAGRNAVLMATRRSMVPEGQAQIVFEGTTAPNGTDDPAQGSTLRVVLAMFGAWETESAHAGR